MKIIEMLDKAKKELIPFKDKISFLYNSKELAIVSKNIKEEQLANELEKTFDELDTKFSLLVDAIFNNITIGDDLTGIVKSKNKRYFSKTPKFYGCKKHNGYNIFKVLWEFENPINNKIENFDVNTIKENIYWLLHQC